MLVLGYIVLGFLALRLVIAGLNWLQQPYLPNPEKDYQPWISILVPARNEAHNLPHLLTQIAGLEYPKLELLVLDDHSEDDTAHILSQAQALYPFLKPLSGQPLPQDWLGKNWACHQLAEAATGEYMIFLDADIAELKHGLIERVLSDMKRKNLALLSIFPNQIMKSWGERLVVPIMHFLLLSLLPLRWIYALPFPSMAAANGQFMAFSAGPYRQHNWHRQVAEVIVEDIAIMQQVKKAGLRGMTYLGGSWIRCRMYQDFWGGVQGFSKNMLAGFGNQAWGLLLYLFLLYLAWALLLFSFSWTQLGWVWGAMLCLRWLINDLAGQSQSWNLLLHPLQMTVLVFIGFRSIYIKLTGNIEWKGRKLR